MIEVRNYVDGKWVTPPCERFSSRNPFTAEVLSTAPESDERAVDAAVEAARAAFDGGGWRWQKGSERAAALHAFADTLEQQASPIAKLIAREMGKPITVALTREVEGAIDKLRYYAGMARNLDGRVLGGTLPEIWDMELPEPIGVCALIVPWNDPVDLAVRKMGAALAAGCSMVVKSSEVTPRRSSPARMNQVLSRPASSTTSMAARRQAKRWFPIRESTRSVLQGRPKPAFA
jgi:acyl-CoA reductase-like NAD-dependent aldehyde dehydrogenase